MYTLTVVDVACCYKEAEPLSTKEIEEVADALKRIYKWSPLHLPKLLVRIVLDPDLGNLYILTCRDSFDSVGISCVTWGLPNIPLSSKRTFPWLPAG